MKSDKISRSRLNAARTEAIAKCVANADEFTTISEIASTVHCCSEKVRDWCETHIANGGTLPFAYREHVKRRRANRPKHVKRNQKSASDLLETRMAIASAPLIGVTEPAPNPYDDEELEELEALVASCEDDDEEDIFVDFFDESPLLMVRDMHAALGTIVDTLAGHYDFIADYYASTSSRGSHKFSRASKNLRLLASISNSLAGLGD